MTIALYGNALLRIAIRRNLVTFPAQIPAFMKTPAGHTQQRIVQLYFVRGWSVRDICERYRLGKKTVQNLLSDWRIRAISAGSIQDIQPENLDRLAAEYQGAERDGHFLDFEPQCRARNSRLAVPPAGRFEPQAQAFTSGWSTKSMFNSQNLAGATAYSVENPCRHPPGRRQTPCREWRSGLAVLSPHGVFQHGLRYRRSLAGRGSDRFLPYRSLRSGAAGYQHARQGI